MANIALVIGCVCIVDSPARARSVAARAQINNFLAALGQYKEDTGSFPTAQQGLAVLYTRPSGVNNWQGPYLRKSVPLDPWGHAYVYRYSGERPEIISYGADGQPGGTGINADVVER